MWVSIYLNEEFKVAEEVEVQQCQDYRDVGLSTSLSRQVIVSLGQVVVLKDTDSDPQYNQQL